MDESIQKHLEQQQVAMKFSTAIRIGALMGPQCTEEYIDGRSSCAIGAAAMATVGAETFEKWWASQVDEWLASFGINQVVGNEIVLRNDDLKQTREEIADWLEAQGL